MCEDDSFATSMGDSDEPVVWIGTPQNDKQQEDVLDPYTSKIGGQAVFFRVNEGADGHRDTGLLSTAFHCPQCKSVTHVSLLSQVYAPMEVYDRVLYVLMCSQCSKRSTAAGGQRVASASGMSSVSAKHFSAAPSHTSFCFALRSQNFSKTYYKELITEQQQRAHEELAKAAAVDDTPLFEEGIEDWGEGAEDWGSSDEAGVRYDLSGIAPVESEALQDESCSAAAMVQDPVPVEEPSYPISKRGMVVPLKGILYTDGIALDLYPEPLPAKMAKETSLEEQLALLQSKYDGSDVVDMDGFEELDSETPQEKITQAYMDRIELAPSQCVRWCPGGSPLRTHFKSTESRVPPCPFCGAARQFEMQLVAPLVYFLTKDIGEKNNECLHFSNVLIYTCSQHCYDKERLYAPEHVEVEIEM